MIEQQWPNEVLFPLLQRVRNDSAELLGFGQLAENFSGGLTILNNINEQEGLHRFEATAPNLVLSIRYGVILREPALSIPEHGVLNLHSGLLPDYKGVMATFWALLNSEQRIGTTLHYIDDSSIDTGRIVESTELAVRKDRSYFWHVMELYREGCCSMGNAVARISAAQALPANPQSAGGNYYSFPVDEDLEKFRLAGWRLWDNADVIELHQRFLPHV